MEIPICAATDPVERMTKELDRAGCLVVTDLLTAEQHTAVIDELAPFMENAYVGADKPDEFYPGNTKRVSALVARSATVRDLVTHPVPNALAVSHLGDNCTHHQLHVTAALEIGPGARKQVLHREEDPFPFFSLPRPNLILATMWAISEFRADNGGTLLVPGSHRWDADRRAEPDEVVSAEMPAGSMLVWLGGTLHGGGANTTADEWRYGIILTYSLGWLRQEENQFLDIPKELLEDFSPELLRLTGHTMHEALGFFDPAVS